MERIRARYPGKRVEVEADCLDQVRAALDAGADRILLDNMPLPLLRRAVETVAGRIATEASGGSASTRCARWPSAGWTSSRWGRSPIRRRWPISPWSWNRSGESRRPGPGLAARGWGRAGPRRGSWPGGPASASRICAGGCGAWSATVSGSESGSGPVAPPSPARAPDRRPDCRPPGARQGGGAPASGSWRRPDPPTRPCSAGPAAGPQEGTVALAELQTQAGAGWAAAGRAPEAGACSSRSSSILPPARPATPVLP